MALRTKYSSLDMVRMANFAKENPDIKPIPLIKAYNDKYPEVTMEQKLANISNWLDDNEVIAIVEYDTSCECEVCPDCGQPTDGISQVCPDCQFNNDFAGRT